MCMCTLHCFNTALRNYKKSFATGWNFNLFSYEKIVFRNIHDVHIRIIVFFVGVPQIIYSTKNQVWTKKSDPFPI